LTFRNYEQPSFGSRKSTDLKPEESDNVLPDHIANVKGEMILEWSHNGTMINSRKRKENSEEDLLEFHFLHDESHAKSFEIKPGSALL
jgi:hypothetical protein